MKILIVGGALKYLIEEFIPFLVKEGHTVERCFVHKQKSLMGPVGATFEKISKDYDLIIFFQLYTYINEIRAHINYFKVQNPNLKIFDNGLFSNGYAIDKTADLTKLSLGGFTIPRSANYKRINTYTAITEDFQYPFVAKKVNASKGKGVFLIKNVSELESLVSIKKDEYTSVSRYIFQDYIDYVLDLRLLVIGEKVFGMQRIPSKGEFRANYSLGGSVKKYEVGKELAALALQAAECVGLKVAGVDVLIDKEGKKTFLEVNHNPGFSGMEKAQETSMCQIFWNTILENRY